MKALLHFTCEAPSGFPGFMGYRRGWTVVALAHLALVTYSAAHGSFLSGVCARVVAFYAAASGAGSSYGYFAPRVGTHLRATMEVRHSDGAVHTRALDEGLDREGRIRVGNIVGGFWENVHDRKRQRALTASWAGKLFAQDPLAKQVTVKIEKFLLPSMEKHRAGRASQWKPYYDATFERRSSSSR